MRTRRSLAKRTCDIADSARSIRLAPPLVIEEEDLDIVIKTLREALEEFDTVETIPGQEYKGSDKPFAAL
jgi:acetylornithine/succinyldiaminopimelate/putrescine aminotransferase